MTTLQDWTAFFAPEVGATAALAGLVIVAISINLAKILEFVPLVARAGETLVMLIGAMLAASIMLVPQSDMLKGAEIAVVGAFVWAAPTIAQTRAAFLPRADARDRPLVRFLFTQLTTVPALAGGALLWAGAESGVYWIAAGVLMALVAGVMNTWVLLIEILR
ncbi:MAG: hypothetical protein JOZ55_03550 [Alphaproteobacteria bacterium]|nr:hypothetical protein [Alphaproteobacteria bacterium]